MVFNRRYVLVGRGQPPVERALEFVHAIVVVRREELNRDPLLVGFEFLFDSE